ncbi:MAG: PQQ-dependent dehydrogenase, methanol/ethanol family [Rhodobacteraceae bacterium]|nr:PQQ-dependent dehydrogenase, methanol/ethanol family [Paracoccaceae bacterium]
MKSLYPAIAVALALSTPVYAQSADQLVNDTATPGDVLTYGMGYGQQRYSQLDQINADNVGQLTPAWVYSLDDSRGQESHPLVKDGVMYVTTHRSTMALDAKSGKQIWKNLIEYPAETPRVACCGIVNRGAALYEGKLFRTTLDANVVAMDAATGEEIWKTNSIDFKNGYSFTVAPLVVNGVVIVGISGGEYGIRGYIEAYDAETGEQLWRTYTVPAPGEPGSETWPETDAWERGGGPAWLTGTYDADLDTVYWGTGNAGSWNAGLRPGDNLYTTSILALNPKTGEIKWHYQTTPNDPFDYDATNELVLAELDGQKVIMQANRNGFFYVLDRESGKLLAANKFVDRVDWATDIDLETGRPNQTEVATAARTGEQVEFWPSALGGKNWSPISYNQNTGLAYINTQNIGMNYKAVEPTYRAGVFYFGAEFSWSWPEGERGFLRAIDPMSGEVKWESGTDIPRYAGIMSTAGNVVFTGQQTGEFEAFHAETGEKLYEFNVGTGIVGQPMTWEQDGDQYVALAVGSGAVYTLFSGDERLAATPSGGAVWAFKLSK